MHERKFPLFVSLTGREVLLFGGGQVALRRARTLLVFGPDLTVIAPELDPAFLSLPVRLERRVYRPGELARPFLVLAATSDGDVNRAIAAEARSKGALANNASDCRDCDFFFPAVVLAEEWTAGLTGTGENHRAVKEAAAKIREMAP